MTTEKQTLITLRSSDLEEFAISESSAAVSLTVKRILEDDECQKRSVIPLLNVDGKTLASIVSYMNAHASGGEHKEFDGDFVSEKEVDVLLVVIKAANYLDIPGLFDLLCRSIADRIKDKSVEYVKKLFDQVNDFRPEEEDEIRSHNRWIFEDVDQKPESN